MRFKHIVIIFLAAIAWSSCNIINPVEKVPTYVYIDSFSFIGRPNTGGSSTGISTAWVYYNNNPVGVFDLPALVPIVATGHGSLEIAPGIPVDGVTSLMSQYPFYVFDTSSFDASPGNSGNPVRRAPVTQYKPTSLIQFPWIEGFDGENSFTPNDSTSQYSPLKAITKDTAITGYTGTSSSKVLDGTGAGLILLTAPGDSSENISQHRYSITAGVPAFCEINYNSTATFYIGLVPVGSDGTTLLADPYYLVGVNPNGGGKWSKIYITLGDFVQQYALYPGTTFNIVVKATLPTNQTNGYVLLDDMKLVVELPQ